jgi:hypothetical protein
MKRALATAACAALVACPAALAHGGGVAGFSSTVRTVSPPVPGLRVRVLERDDRLLLTDAGGEEVVILGYDGEPYLRFADGKVYENRNSPAVYLNGDRFGNVQLPPNADPDAKPKWLVAARSNAYDWHDHRIHWMSTIAPAKIRAAPTQRHHVLSWQVPGVADGKRFAIVGSLDYTPVPKRTLWPFVVAGAAVVVLLSAAGLLFASRYRAR